MMSRSGGFEAGLIRHIESYCAHYKNAKDLQMLRPGQRLAAILAAASLLQREGTLGQAYMAYLLMLLQELRDPERGTNLLLSHMHNGREQLSTVGLEIARLHAEDRQKQAGRGQFSNDGIGASVTSALDDRWGEPCHVDDGMTTRLKHRVAALFAKDPSSHEFGAASLQETAAGERMSWGMLLAPFPSPLPSSCAGCVRGLVRLMHYERLANLLLDAGLPAQADDNGSGDGDRTMMWGDAIAVPGEVKRGTIIANRIAASLQVWSDPGAMYTSRADVRMLARGPNQPDVAFSMQYGVHCMLLNADGDDWAERKSKTIFTENRLNQMSAAAVLALVRVGCSGSSIPSSDVLLVRGNAPPKMDDAEEAALLGPQAYSFRLYVKWKKLVCTSCPLVASFSRLGPENAFAPRKLDPLSCTVGGDDALDSDPVDSHTAIDWSAVLLPSSSGETAAAAAPSLQQQLYTPLQFLDEWLDLRTEARVSHDIFIMIRKLLLEEGSLYGGGSRVGHFVMFNEDSASAAAAAAGGSSDNDTGHWDDGIIVFQVERRVQVGRSRNAGVVNRTYYEVLYASGKVRWHSSADLLEAGGRFFAYADVQDYLRACGMTLQRWVGRFEHGKGSASGDASDAFLNEWKSVYGL